MHRANDGTYERYTVTYKNGEITDIRDSKGADKMSEKEKVYEDTNWKQNKARTRYHFTRIESGLTMFSGLSGLSQLFMSNEALAEWRRRVDEYFCNTIVFGGVDCWVSLICESKIDRTAESTLTMTTPSGMTTAVAHVEGQRTKLEFQNNSETVTSYIYKITFYVKNPSYSGIDSFDFNVYLYREGKAQTTLLKEHQKLKEGQYYHKTGTTMVVQESSNYYDIICIHFNKVLSVGEGEEASEVCNRIAGYTGSAESYSKASKSGGLATNTGTGGEINTI